MRPAKYQIAVAVGALLVLYSLTWVQASRTAPQALDNQMAQLFVAQMRATDPELTESEATALAQEAIRSRMWKLHIDHVIPIAPGLALSRHRLLCSSKQAKTILEIQQMSILVSLVTSSHVLHTFAGGVSP